MKYVFDRDDLARDGTSLELQGAEYGANGISLILVDGEVGHGPALHSHPYEEVFIVLEGRATFTVGDTEVEAHAGQIVIAPPNAPHKFVNTGDGPLKQIDIHANGEFITEWLED